MIMEFLYVLLDAIYILFPFVYLDDDLDHKADAKFIGNHVLLVWLYAAMNILMIKLDLTDLQQECMTLVLAFLIIFFYEMKIDLYRILIGLTSWIISDMSVLCISSVCQFLFDIRENAILLTFLVKIIRMILLLLVCRYIRKLIDIDQKEQLKDGVLLLLPFSILFEICFHRVFTGNNPYVESDIYSLKDSYIFLELYAITAALILDVIFVNHFHLEKQRLQQEKMIAYSTRSSAQSLQQISDRENALKKLRHDMNARLVTIRSLYQNGEKEKAEKAIEDTIGKIRETGRQTYCPIGYINDLIQYKQEQNSSIKFEVEANCEKDPDIDPMDLSVLLSNLIDNACRETIKKEIHKKYISIMIKQNHQLLTIKITNPLVSETDFVSDKNSPDHGFGLQIVKKIADQYDGYIDIRQDTEFQVTVILNLKNENEKEESVQMENHKEGSPGNYFIRFKNEEKKKEALPFLKKIAIWENYGSLGIRGNAPDRKVISETIIQNTSLTEDDFEIIQGLPGYLGRY